MSIRKFFEADKKNWMLIILFLCPLVHSLCARCVTSFLFKVFFFKCFQLYDAKQMKWLICFAYWPLLLSIKCATEMSAYLSFAGIHKKKFNSLNRYLSSLLDGNSLTNGLKAITISTTNSSSYFQLHSGSKSTFVLKCVYAVERQKKQWQWQAVQLKSFQLRNERHTHTQKRMQETNELNGQWYFMYATTELRILNELR